MSNIIVVYRALTGIYFRASSPCSLYISLVFYLSRFSFIWERVNPPLSENGEKSYWIRWMSDNCCGRNYFWLLYYQIYRVLFSACEFFSQVYFVFSCYGNLFWPIRFSLYPQEALFKADQRVKYHASIL
jgi:hypothetical protein